MGQIVHIVFDQPLKIEHHPRASLRVGRGPGGLGSKGGLHRTLQHGCIAQGNTRLNATIIGIIHIPKPNRRSTRSTRNEMINLAHAGYSLPKLLDEPLPY
jgi:hypothetical protein